MESIVNLSGVLQLAAAAISLGAALYLARFKYTFIEELKKQFLLKPEDVKDMPVTRRENEIHEEYAKREHARFDAESTKLWAAINKIETTGCDFNHRERE